MGLKLADNSRNMTKLARRNMTQQNNVDKIKQELKPFWHISKTNARTASEHVQGAEEHGVDKRQKQNGFLTFSCRVHVRRAFIIVLLCIQIREDSKFVVDATFHRSAGSLSCVIRIRCARWIYSFHMMAKPFDCYLWV